MMKELHITDLAAHDNVGAIQAIIALGPELPETLRKDLVSALQSADVSNWVKASAAYICGQLKIAEAKPILTEHIMDTWVVSSDRPDSYHVDPAAALLYYGEDALGAIESVIRSADRQEVVTKCTIMLFYITQNKEVVHQTLLSLMSERPESDHHLFEGALAGLKEWKG